MATVAMIGAFAWGQEHPTGAPAEHPHTSAKPTVSLNDVEQGIKAYVKEHSTNGAFVFHDDKTGKDLSLKLVRVHHDRLSAVGPDLYFACTDFKGADGRMYDLDFFAQGMTKDNLKVIEKETSVHKVDGKPRYNWYYDKGSGLWKKRFVSSGASKGQMEHPQESRHADTDSGMTGQNSMQEMMRSMMSGVLPAGVKPGDLPDAGSRGAKLMAASCVQCHNLPSPSMHSAAEWPGVADKMFQRMSMCSRMSGGGMMGRMGGMGMQGMMGMMNVKAPSAKEREIIVAYLKKHSLKSIERNALPTPRSKGAALFAATCTQCHALPDPHQHTARQWPQVVAHMRENMVVMKKTIPDADALRRITKFLENAAQAKP